MIGDKPNFSFQLSSFSFSALQVAPGRHAAFK
jgi:hypothetical protein